MPRDALSWQSMKAKQRREARAQHEFEERVRELFFLALQRQEFVRALDDLNEAEGDGDMSFDERFRRVMADPACRAYLKHAFGLERTRNELESLRRMIGDGLKRNTAGGAEVEGDDEQVSVGLEGNTGLMAVALEFVKPEQLV